MSFCTSFYFWLTWGVLSGVGSAMTSVVKLDDWASTPVKAATVRKKVAKESCILTE